jgi:hypothetical protein
MLRVLNRENILAYAYRQPRKAVGVWPLRTQVLFDCRPITRETEGSIRRDHDRAHSLQYAQSEDRQPREVVRLNAAELCG